MEGMRTFLFDIDGVIHNGGTEIPGAARALAALRGSGRQVLFLTNNATKTPEDVVALFASFGAEATPDEVMTSAVAAADYLRAAGQEGRLVGKQVYVVGMRALQNIVASVGDELGTFSTFGGEDDAPKGRADVVQEFNPSLSPPPEDVPPPRSAPTTTSTTTSWRGRRTT
ncbi:unnamed protein product [Prorocentrum cordatum]|uniref:Uncharacterized protein n=1 Tax=Prorocentrum cordatum TaxID=2364126 RepID=A0ABN9SKL1_9DINO|nr:unnamed protein product [Polarella glacialis]